ncbi:MAG: hypothetical protein MO846_00920 [Candidatus Devosia symbiotica]|nr:hypothetical protein [Candidatus Devosia symbiotica]
MNLRITGMEFASEMMVKGTLAQLDVREVPATFAKDSPPRPICARFAMASSISFSAAIFATLAVSLSWHSSVVAWPNGRRDPAARFGALWQYQF